jgi:hypothetical protein
VPCLPGRNDTRVAFIPSKGHLGRPGNRINRRLFAALLIEALMASMRVVGPPIAVRR